MSSEVSENIYISEEGNYKIFLDRKYVKSKEFKDTLSQIDRTVRHPTMEHVRLMPDCHYGSGCCVGLTSQLNTKVLPRLIGGDIGCGILTYSLHKYEKTLKLEKLDKDIRSIICLGTTNNKEYANKNDIDDLCKASQHEAVEFALAYKNKFGVNIDSYIPKYSPEWFQKKCKEIKINYDMVLKSLCTLGSGNHYIEINTDGKTNYLTIHSGSRAFGGKICKHHQDKIDTKRELDWEKYNHKLRQVKKTYKKNPHEMERIIENLKQEFTPQKHEDYLEGEEAYLYFFDMIFAQKFAELNRFLMLRRVLEEVFYIQFDEKDKIQSIHNYIDFRNMILRKGAISCHKGQKCIISLNMRDGILICEGKTDNEDWNLSAPHGAGRNFSRGEAESRITLKQFQESMKDVYSTSVVKQTIDESPDAYRDTQLIVDSISNTIEIKSHLKAILNIKALN